MDSVSAYKQKLHEIASEVPLSDMTNSKWNQLNDMITEEVLEDTHRTSVALSMANKELRPRAEKKAMARILVKKKMNRPDLGFKTNCDLMAFRILVRDVRGIPSVVNKVVQDNEAMGNPVFVRSPILDPVTNKLNDIVQFMYVYHVKEGYLAEYQIGHPFAALTFEHDSMFRDTPTVPGVMDFYHAKVNVYKLVKEQLLNPKDDFDFVQTWIAGFGAPPSQEWMDVMT
jgi:hypothetical protein